MKALAFNRLHYYLKVEAALFASTLKTMLEYRLNFVVQLLYGPAYVFILYLVMQTVYAKAPNLGGFNRHEAQLLFASFHLLYATCIIFFMKGVKHFVWQGARTGEADLVLTKPISPQFLLAFSKPEIQQIVLWLGMAFLFGLSLQNLQLPFNVLNITSFLLMFALGCVICYLTQTIYMTAGFLVSKANQVIELYDKVTDYAHYPMPIFPSSLQAVFITLIPTAFFGYFPVMFLLGRGQWYWIPASLFAVVVFTALNKIAWWYALRRYSSASS